MKRRLVVNFNDDRSRWAITPAARAAIQRALPADWELVPINAHVSSRGDGSGAPAEAIAAMPNTEVYIGFGFPRELFLAATHSGPQRLRWVHTGAAGVGALLFPEMLASDVVITNSAGIHAPPMAETVMAAALHFARGIDFAVRNQQRFSWDQIHFESDTSPIVELAGGTMGILGLGGIGREVARRALALGMRVIATRRSGRSEDGIEVLKGDRAGVERVLRESDVVVIAMPSTPETRGLVGEYELSLLKPGAILINVARGNIVVESALIEVLREKRIRGAALDVFEHEPLGADSPLWSLPNALVMPHVSATTPRYWERETTLIVENLRRYLKGDALENVVDKNAGY